MIYTFIETIKQATQQLKQKNLFLCFLILVIYITSWFLQNTLPFRSDISALIYVVRLLLAGGNYVNDFFTPNTPMILYLYTPPVFISELFSLNTLLTFRIYFFGLGSLSFFICCFLTRNIFLKQDAKIKNIFLITILSIFLLMPMAEFGQRDHLLVVLTIPYFLLVVNKLKGNFISNKYAFFIGVLAGIGFGIKPQFIITFIFIEGYYVFYKKDLLGWVRTETLTISGLLFLYVISLFLFYQPLLVIIFPYITASYYKNIGTPLVKLLTSPIALYCWLPFVLSAIQYKNNPYKILCSVLLVSLAGFLISYYTQHTLFFYHLFPAFSISFLLLTLLFASLIKTQAKTIYYLVLVFSALMIPSIYESSLITTTLTLCPTIFVSFFCVLLFILLYLNDSAYLKMFIYPIVYLMIGSICSSMIKQTSSSYLSNFYIIFFLLVGLCGLALPKTPRRQLFGQINLFLLSVLLFAFPIYALNINYYDAIIYKNFRLNTLIAFMRTQPQKQSLYAFTAGTDLIFPLIDYTNNFSTQLFDCLWMVNSLVKKRSLEGDASLRQYIKENHDKYFFINLIAENIRTHPPDLIFVDDNPLNSKLYFKGMIKGFHFDYLSYFLENPLFRKEWKHYRYLTTLANKDNSFRILIYKHIY